MCTIYMYVYMYMHVHLYVDSNTHVHCVYEHVPPRFAIIIEKLECTVLSVLKLCDTRTQLTTTPGQSFAGTCTVIHVHSRDLSPSEDEYFLSLLHVGNELQCLYRKLQIYDINNKG